MKTLQGNFSEAFSLRKRFDGFELRKVDRSVQRDLHHGWLFPIIFQFDGLTWGRWKYHLENIERGYLDETPIPEIWIEDQAHTQTRKMIEQCLNAIPDHGAWGTWGSATYIDYFLDWVLFAMGDPAIPELPAEPVGCSGASMRLYQLFQAEALTLWPHDYIGDLLCETSFGRGAAFYPTPHTLVQLMVQMQFPDDQADYRRASVMDPCVGTGRMLLYASNYSLRLFGMDILSTCCKATRFNAAFIAPWMFRPLAFLEQKESDYEVSASLASEMAKALGVSEWDRVLIHGGHESAYRSILADWPEEASLSFSASEESRVRDLVARGFPATYSPLWGNRWDRILLLPALGEARDCVAVRDAYERLAPGGKLVALMSDWWTLCDGPVFTEFREWLAPLTHDRRGETYRPASQDAPTRTLLLTIKKEPTK